MQSVWENDNIMQSVYSRQYLLFTERIPSKMWKNFKLVITGFWLIAVAL